MSTVYDMQLDSVQAMRGRLFDLPGYVLDRLAERVIDKGWVPRVDSDPRCGRRLVADRVRVSPDCRRDGHGSCLWADCRCGCHGGQEYVPVRGWLPAAQAQADRRAYLDEDAAIERAYERQGDV